MELMRRGAPSRTPTRRKSLSRTSDSFISFLDSEDSDIHKIIIIRLIQAKATSKKCRTLSRSLCAQNSNQESTEKHKDEYRQSARIQTSTKKHIDIMRAKIGLESSKLSIPGTASHPPQKSQEGQDQQLQAGIKDTGKVQAETDDEQQKKLKEMLEDIQNQMLSDEEGNCSAACGPKATFLIGDQEAQDAYDVKCGKEAEGEDKQASHDKEMKRIGCAGDGYKILFERLLGDARELGGASTKMLLPKTDDGTRTLPDSKKVLSLFTQFVYDQIDWLAAGILMDISVNRLLSSEQERSEQHAEFSPLATQINVDKIMAARKEKFSSDDIEQDTLPTAVKKLWKIVAQKRINEWQHVLEHEFRFDLSLTTPNTNEKQRVFAGWNGESFLPGTTWTDLPEVPPADTLNAEEVDAIKKHKNWIDQQFWKKESWTGAITQENPDDQLLLSGNGRDMHVIANVDIEASKRFAPAKEVRGYIARGLPETSG